MRHDNYPDDIHCFDSNPQSPFYVDPDAWMDFAIDSLADEWLAEYNETGIIVYNGYEKADLEELMEAGGWMDIEETIAVLAREAVEGYPDEYRPEPMPLDEWEI